MYALTWKERVTPSGRKIAALRASARRTSDSDSGAVLTERPPLGVFGVGQPLSPEPEPLPDVRRPCARSAAIFRPDGVTRSFQVSAYKVEPSKAVLGSDLLAEDGDRLALLDVPVPERP